MSRVVNGTSISPDSPTFPAPATLGPIVVASAVAIFTELAVIRYEGSVVPILAIFKNLSLIACFVGLGIGFSRGAVQRTSIFDFLARFFFLVVFLTVLDASDISTAIGNPISEQLAMGFYTAYGLERALCFGIIFLIFLLTISLFIPLGEFAGSLMESTPSKLEAYGCNLLGSLLGIGVFSILCWFCVGPIIWFAVVFCALAPYFPSRGKSCAAAASLFAIALVLISLQFRVDEKHMFSPYQNLVLTHLPKSPPSIATNGLYFQKMLDLSPQNNERQADESRVYYDLPYKIIPNPDSVLIVGSGSGNDVAAALRGGAKQIVGVEIDPIILQIGKTIHPEQPYSSPKVKAVLSDARKFFRATEEKYDVIIYGLLDSHTLLSGFTGGLRLDSYVYTLEALQEAKKRLKPGGVIFLSFVYMSKAFAKKIFEMLTIVFDGEHPIVFNHQYDTASTYISGRKLTDLEYAKIDNSNEISRDLKQLKMETSPSTDNWPFLYMPARAFPTSYAPILLVMFLVSFIFIQNEPQFHQGKFSLAPFFLGAGFMLIETKALTELALEFGAVFSVMTVTIASILLLAFLANLYVSKGGRPADSLVYGSLLASIAIGFALTFRSSDLLTAGSVLVPLVLTIPMFFSGIAFSYELQRRDKIGSVLGVNLLGAVLGAVLEYLSMYYGFRALYIVAFALYAAAFATRARAKI